MDYGLTHTGSRTGFLGENPSEELEAAYSSEKQVTSATPRALILLSADDKTVVPANSLRYFDALNKAGVPASLMVYPTGGHGWGYREKFRYHDNVLSEITAWLKSL